MTAERTFPVWVKLHRKARIGKAGFSEGLFRERQQILVRTCIRDFLRKCLLCLVRKLSFYLILNRHWENSFEITNTVFHSHGAFFIDGRLLTGTDNTQSNSTRMGMEMSQPGTKALTGCLLKARMEYIPLPHTNPPKQEKIKILNTYRVFKKTLRNLFKTCIINPVSYFMYQFFSVLLNYMLVTFKKLWLLGWISCVSRVETSVPKPPFVQKPPICSHPDHPLESKLPESLNLPLCFSYQILAPVPTSAGFLQLGCGDYGLPHM